ncbi:MAG: ribonuclease Y [Dehalococcoidia bacterium]|nr:ribonuclease Y [Dehalococcoidia bacterium]
MLVIILVGVVALSIGGAAGYLVLRLWEQRKRQTIQQITEARMEEAKAKEKEILLGAKEEAIRIRAGAESEYRERRAELQRQERRVTQKGENLDRKLEGVDQREHRLTDREKETEAIRNQVLELKNREIKQLEAIAAMTSQEAKQALLQSLEQEVRTEASRRMVEWVSEVKAQADTKAREILSLAIQRTAGDVISEATTSVVPLPNDEMKGRLIGREGRNIRALEQATGVDLIIDDTPEAVTVSSFDPVRREIARLSLTRLIQDGRIHPARIEEVVEKAKNEVDATIISEGEATALKAGVQALHPELIKLLGRLKYRTSYGQNVLGHSLEVSQLAGHIAAELGADVAISKKAGLLHDLGKGVDHAVEGPHAVIGANLVKQWEKSQDVVQAVAEHHLESPTSSIYSYIISTADAISAARPGARGEALEQYLQRLQALETIATGFQGVEKAFAVQAGREVRIMVKPDSIDDIGAMRLARDIAKKIEDSLQYPGQIRITVIRETRAVEYAK